MHIVILLKSWLHHLPQRLRTPGELGNGDRPPPGPGSDLASGSERKHLSGCSVCALRAAAKMGINESLGFGSGGPSNP